MILMNYFNNDSINWPLWGAFDKFLFFTDETFKNFYFISWTEITFEISSKKSEGYIL